MRFEIEGACGCHTGKIRKTNEDNFYFAGKCLEEKHNGLRHTVRMEESTNNGFMIAVFDGLGGENYGEIAAFSAARQMQRKNRAVSDFFISEKTFLKQITKQLNEAVVAEKQRLSTEHMGTTEVIFYFSGKHVYVCNVGDSRAYRLRGREFMQVSKDHVESFVHRGRKKPGLTQCLGIPEEQMQIEPYIAKGRLESGDRYLLCSDGLTDMLSDLEISQILVENEDSGDCVDLLIGAALDRGGRDNITVIVCCVK